MSNIEELKRLAEAATPGPWYDRCGVLRGTGGEVKPIATIYRAFNSAYIAAANPAAVLELIAEVEYLRGKNREHFDACIGCDEELKRVTKQRDELLTHIPEWHCKTCNTVHLPPEGLNLRCKTPKCTGLLKPSSQSIRIVEDERDQLLAALKDARRELAYAGRQEAHDAASAAIAKAEG